MTLFVDASALVAIIAGETESADFTERVRDDPDPLWSAMSQWETISALYRSYAYDVSSARLRVADVGAAAGFTMVAIADVESAIALDAYQRYGRGRHPAKLNMGDCFAYACAKANNARLLYKGNDFALTDLA